MSEPGRMARWRARLPTRWTWLGIAIVAVGVAALLLHASEYSTFFFDDSFISLRYADRLRSGLGLTWTDAERVEGYTNFLWVVLLGFIGLFNEGLVEPARIAGVVCTAIAFAAIVVVTRPRKLVEAAAPLYGVLALALSGPVAAWSIGGLEQPLLVACLACAIVALLRLVDAAEPRATGAIVAGVFLGLACLTRPDSPIFVVTLGAGLVIARGFDRRSFVLAFWTCLVPALFVAAHTAFRRLYYDAWVPNTASKLRPSAARLELGWEYVSGHAELRFGLLYAAAAALVVAVFVREVRRRVLLVLPALVAWTSYVVVIGGDFMPQKRHLVPSLFFAALVATLALAWMARQRAGWPAVAWVAAPPLLLHLGFAQQRDPAKPDANLSHWYWEARPIGHFFRKAFGASDPLLAVDAAGALPYFWKGRALDMLGLNDRWIATHPPKEHGRGMIGHDLGDGVYVLDRDPDLVVFHLPHGYERPHWKSGHQMVRLPEWRSHYTLVPYETPPPKVVRGKVWVRRRDGPLGMKEARDRVVVPGYLLASPKSGVAVLDSAGRAAVRFGGNDTLAVKDLRLSPGTWRLDAEATQEIELSARVRGARFAEQGVDRVTFEVFGRAPRAVDIEVRSSKRGATLLSRLVLEKQP